MADIPALQAEIRERLDDPRSASERWGAHFFSCDVCHIDEREPERDRLCRIGSELRAASIAEMRRGPA